MKIEAAIPERTRACADRAAIMAPAWRGEQGEAFGHLLDRLNEAIGARRVLRLDYRDERGETSTRDIEPLCIVFWGGSWTLGAWCRLRSAFRQFRLNRIDAMQATGEIAPVDPDRGLQALLREVRRTPAFQAAREARVSPPTVVA